jgi:hypothetical protein
MPAVKLTGGGKPVSDCDIAKWENSSRLKLPSMYREFLLRNNGGRPNKHVFPGPVGCYVERFFALSPLDSMSLEHEVEAMKADLPPDVIPIAITGNGDRVCLELESGKIYLWDHEMEYRRKRAAKDEMGILANNIDDFLSRLEGDDPLTTSTDATIEDLGRWGDLESLNEYLTSGGDISAVSASGAGIITYAAYKGHLDFIKECMRREASPRGALHAAVFAGKGEVIRFLLEHGVDPNEQDDRGRRPLDCVPDLVYQRRPPYLTFVEERGGRRSPTAEAVSQTDPRTPQYPFK